MPGSSRQKVVFSMPILSDSADLANTKSPPPDIELPTADEVFGRPYPPAPPIPPAWEGESIAVEITDQECARLIANCMFDPPITEADIDQHARRFKLSRREAELEIREARRV
jgi:hypothetical protein